MKVHVGRANDNTFYFWAEGSRKEYYLTGEDELSCIDDRLQFKNKSEYIEDLKNTECVYIGCVVIKKLTVENLKKVMPEVFL